MSGTLIIKLGALGDVLRTTPLLRRLEGEVTWVTGKEALPLLAGNTRIARLLDISRTVEVRGRRFDRVINFDEDRAACALASAVRARRRTGAFLKDGKISYCAASAPWFDMSLISRLGRQEADRLKLANRRSYQSLLFSACGLRFAGEEYLMPLRVPATPGPLVALEPRTGERWPLKRWPGCRELARLLAERGVPHFFLRRRHSLTDYLRDIGRCSVLVSGDTLAMHAALGFKRRAVAVFNCTSPLEIYGYGRLYRLVNQRLRENFYSRARPPRDFPHVPAAAALDKVLAALGTP